MNEDTFVRSLQRRIQRDHPGAVILRPNDRSTEGIPDLLVYHRICVAALECKSVGHDPRDPDAPWLSHPFSMPQATLLRDLASQGVVALGLVEHMTSGRVYALHPRGISPSLSLTNVMNFGCLLPPDGSGRILENLKFAMGHTLARRS